MMEQRNDWAGWRAVIHPTTLGTFGILWYDAPAMERRGGWSGPYSSREDAEKSAREWLASWEVTDFTIEHSEAVE